MRGTLFLLLTGVVAVQPAPLFAQGNAANPRLEEIVNDIAGEAKRFLAERAESQSFVQDDMATPIGLREIPLKSEVAVILKSTERYVGRWEAANEPLDRFGITTNNGYREFSYQAVQSYTIIKLQGWAAPEVAVGILAGQRLDVRLTNRSQTKGRFVKATLEGLWLEDNPTMLKFEDVSEIKYGRGPTRTIVLIAVGAFAALAVYSLTTLEFGGPGLYPLP